MKDHILKKLKKILALAADPRAPKGEIEAAMARAKQLAMQHSIELATVSFGEDEKVGTIQIEKDDTLKTRTKYEYPHHRWLFHIIKRVFGVRAIVWNRSTSGGNVFTKIVLVGEATDVALAKEVFAWLDQMFPQSFAALVKQGQFVNRAAHMNGYYYGLAHGITEANKKAEEELPAQQAQTWAMVLRRKEDLVEQKYHELFPNAKSRKSRAQQMSEHAQGLGYQKGKSVNLNQLGGSKPSGQIN